MAAVTPNVNVNNNPTAANININNLNTNVNNVNNLNNLASNAHLATHNNQIISHNLLDEVKFFETFSTYKIFSLELISVYCSIRKNKIKLDLMKNDIFTETPLDTSASSMLSQQLQLKDYDITPNQELKIINIILKAIKTADLSVNDLLQSIVDSDMQLYLKLISDRVECLSKHTILELRNLINDLKIYFIGPPLNDPLIRPWSVVGKYVRRCIIIYEKMSFDKIVNLCKEASIQFKYNLILSNPGADDNNNAERNAGKDGTAETSATSTHTVSSKPPAGARSVCFADANAGETAHDELDHNNSPMSGALFLHDESNLTVTSDIFNRSTVDCSGIGMDLDESLSQSIIMHTNNISSGGNANNNATNTSLNVSNNRDFLNKFLAQNMISQKALTSTVSAQRTLALNNLKSGGGPALPSLTDTSVTDSGVVPKSVTFAKKLLGKDDATSGVLNSPALEGSIIMPSAPAPASIRPAASIGARGAGQAPPTKTTHNHVPSGHSYSFSLTNGCAFSRKIAEYFVAQQVRLLENNEHDALNPVELQQKIDELIAYDSSFSDAYYLRYLNYLRLRDYTLALKSLHDYFDRLVLDDSASLAALNLCSLEYRFENKENAFFALKEAITSAHQESDNSCLQHCLSWLYKMEPYSGSNSRKNFLIKNACSRGISNEVYNLAAYNLHYFARNNIGKHKPSAILNLINKTEIVNLKMNSRLEITVLSECHKAALWNLYGHKKLCNLHSQIVLNLVPSSSSIKLNTESQCIAICYLALHFCNNGHYQASQNLIDFCKEKYSTHSKTSEHWKLTENLILIEKNMLCGKWAQARSHIEKLAVISIQQALLHEMNIYIHEGNLDKAKEIGNRILLSMNTNAIDLFQANSFDLNNNASPHYFSGNTGSGNKFEFLNDQIVINLRFNYIQLYIALNEYPNALISAIKFHHEIRQLDLNYEFMVSCLLIAKILIHMEHPEQAIKYLEKCIIFILSNGSLVDQAKLHYLYAKCLYVLNKKKNLETSIAHMKKCVEKLESVQGSIYLLSAYSYLSLLLNEADNTAERNKYAYKFRQLRQQLPLVGYLL